MQQNPDELIDRQLSEMGTWLREANQELRKVHIAELEQASNEARLYANSVWVVYSEIIDEIKEQIDHGTSALVYAEHEVVPSHAQDGRRLELPPGYPPDVDSPARGYDGQARFRSGAGSQPALRLSIARELLPGARYPGKGAACVAGERY